MEVQLVKRDREVGKEFSEVVDAVAFLIAEFKAKKQLAVIAAESLPKVMDAIQGYDQLAEEVKSQYGVESAFYGAEQIVKAILAKPVV